MSRKLPISKRLLCCASLISPGSRVADIGTDHGYLGIYLLKEGKAQYVVAGDLREKPLRRAMENAELYGVHDRIEFVLSDGLANVDAQSIDTIVMAGMGGDLISWILAACDWVRNERYTLILQPQADGQKLRRWLGENGFGMETETLVRDGGFLYTVMRARFGLAMQLSPGQQYVSPQLLSSGCELLGEYVSRIRTALEQTVAGISRAEEPDDAKRAYFEQALEEVREMERNDVNCT